MKSLGVRMRWLFRLVGMSLILPVCVSCALCRERPVETAPTVVLPEVRKITFTGNTQFSSRTLTGEMVSKPRPWLQYWKHGAPYNPPTLQEDVRRIRKYYFDRGFLETTAHVEQLQENAEENTVTIEIAIDEGAPTQVAEVRLTGAIPPELSPVPNLIKALPLQAGQRLNKAAFDQSKELLLTRLHNATYARSEIIPNTEVDPEAHTAVVTFELRPGAPTTFGQITIEGEQQVNERAIRRQLRIREGDPYNATELQESVDTIYGLGMFQAVTPRVLNPNEQGVHQLAQYYRRPPDQLSEAELRQYFLSLLNEKNVAESTFRIHLYGIRFFYELTLKRPWPVFDRVRPRNIQKLPVVFSPREVRDLLALVKNPTARMCLRLIYACGLRLREGTPLQISDIDSQRMLVLVRQGQGGKDRSVPLADRTLQL